MSLKALYKPSLGLLTDLYQLTMSNGYWKSGSYDKETVFNLHFRNHPFGGRQTLFCGLAHAVEFMEQFGFDDSDLDYLSALMGNDNKPLFEPAFLKYLGKMKFECDVDAITEGSVVFPRQPLLRISGPIIQCQILETALLNIVNFQTLVATKAARVVQAAAGDPVLEFGLRRAQGIDGGLAASYAAWIGGCAATSNVLAGKIYGIPVKGTHAHSWIMSFDDELAAFRAYAQAMPNNCVFLVDTYDTREGVRHAAEVGKELAAGGHRMLGIRLDSGDLADLSIKARRILDEAGFEDARIVASNDLDEHLIADLKQKGAKICMWGVGTRLVTAYDQPALGGVYKLSAMRTPDSPWRPCIKLSNDAVKVSIPGIQQVRRFHVAGRPIADMIYDESIGPAQFGKLHLPDGSPPATVNTTAFFEDLLMPIFRRGTRIFSLPDATITRARAIEQSALFAEVLKKDGHYRVGLDENLYAMQQQLIRQAASGNI